jgi:integrase
MKLYEKRNLNGEEIIVIFKPEGVQIAKEKYPKISRYSLLEIEANVRVKDLRHFFGSTMLNRGVDSLEIANQMGHQDLNMLRERYGHYTDEKLHNSSKIWDYTEVKKSQLRANSENL